MNREPIRMRKQRDYFSPRFLFLPTSLSRAVCTWTLLLSLTTVTSQLLAADQSTLLTRADLESAPRRAAIAALIGASLKAALTGNVVSPPADPRIMQAKNGVHIILVRKGRVVGEGLAQSTTLFGNIRVATGKALGKLSATEYRECAVVASLFLAKKPLFSHPAIAIKGLSDLGLDGFVATYRGQTVFLAPLQPLLKSYNWQKTLLALAAKISLPTQSVSTESEAESARLLKVITSAGFKVDLVPSVTLLRLPDAKKFIPLYRLGRVLKISAVTGTAVHDALVRAEHWFATNQKPDGHFVYHYDPVSDQKTSRKHMMNKRAMSVVAIAALWRQTRLASTRAVALKALNALLDEYYLEDPEGRFGYLRDGESPPPLLASAATLWALALLDITAKNPEMKTIALRLEAFLLFLRDSSGRFKTHYQKDNVTSVENTYSGVAQIALLAWAEAGNRIELLRACFESFRYYRTYYAARVKAHKRPPYSFIPWHTQANRQLYRLKKRQELADFIFETNRMVTTAQQIYPTRRVPLPEDCRGRFYPQTYRQNHLAKVSETGEYVTGLVDAFALARELGETEDVKLFRKSILWGVRDLLQLQIKDKIDTLLMPNPARARGGFRTRPSDPRIRLENMSFATLALLKVAKEFKASDYAVAKTLGE